MKRLKETKTNKISKTKSMLKIFPLYVKIIGKMVFEPKLKTHKIRFIE